MRRATLLLVLVPLSLACATPAQAVEQIAVPVTEPRPATLGGDLYLPSGAGPHPAVILLHGCSGITASTTSWALWLRSEGYAALLLDSFTARGLRTVCGYPQPLMGPVRAHDVFAAVARLKALGSVDPSRIAVMGFSHGGWTALWAWRLQEKYPDARLRAIIAFYPSCGGPLADRGAPPLLMLLGGQDDWTPPAPCQMLGEAARDAGRQVSVVLYPEARHAFDAANLIRRLYVSVARGGKGATIEYDPKAHADSEKQVRQFLQAQLGAASLGGAPPGAVPSNAAQPAGSAAPTKP